MISRRSFATAACMAVAISAAPAAAEEIPTILISRQLAAALKLAEGELVRLSADPSGSNPRPFRIVSTYEPMADPMRFSSERLEARLHLPDLLTLTADPDEPLSSDTVSAINVALRQPGAAATFARDLSARMPGLVARPTQAEDDEDSPFVVLRRFHLAIAIVTMLASTIFLLALMVMLVDERRETIGVLRLIGLRKQRILLQLLAEGLLVSLSGALVGIVLAAASQFAFNRFFQWRYDTTLVFVRVTGAIAWRCLALAVPLGTLASLIASWSLLRRSILRLAR